MVGIQGHDHFYLIVYLAFYKAQDPNLAQVSLLEVLDQVQAQVQVQVQVLLDQVQVHLDQVQVRVLEELSV
jgi:hypothetical protein